MSNLDFQLGLLFGHLGRSSPKFKAEGLSINISKVASELGMSAQELNTLLLYAQTEEILSVNLVQAVVKLAVNEPEPLTTAYGAPVHISDVLANHPAAESLEAKVSVTDFAPGDRVSFFAPWTDVDSQVIGTVSGEDCFVANSLIVEFVHPEDNRPVTQTIEVKSLTKLPPESKKKGAAK
jgi:hypothetical protein